MKFPDSFIVRDVELKDRPRWEPLWRDYQAFSRTIPEEVTEMTWRRFSSMALSLCMRWSLKRERR